MTEMPGELDMQSFSERWVVDLNILRELTVCYIQKLTDNVKTQILIWPKGFKSETILILV